MYWLVHPEWQDLMYWKRHDSKSKIYDIVDFVSEHILKIRYYLLFFQWYVIIIIKSYVCICSLFPDSPS